MIIFPNCKINIGLNIVQKRDDGYHNLETIFYPVPVFDVLEIIQADNSEDSLTVTGLQVAGDPNNNLCTKAVQLVRQLVPELPPLKIHLHKTIPMGAGLGGGSSNGAHTLLLLNKKFNLALQQQTLLNLALQLGSDCPFFILNKPCFASGRGEMLEPIDLSLKGMQLVLINPGIHVNTGWAFSQIKPACPAASLKDCGLQSIENWKNTIVNDFQLPVATQYPQIGQLIAYCYEQGALYAAMTGSGSTLFALFAKDEATPEFNNWANLWVQKLEL